MNRNGLSFTDILAPLFVIAIVILSVAGFIGLIQQNTYTDCVVTSTEVTYQNTKSEQNLVHTENCGTFSVNDDAARLNFDGDDTFSSIQDGETYTFTATGFRFLTWYPNVTAVQ